MCWHRVINLSELKQHRNRVKESIRRCQWCPSTDADYWQVLGDSFDTHKKGLLCLFNILDLRLWPANNDSLINHGNGDILSLTKHFLRVLATAPWWRDPALSTWVILIWWREWYQTTCIAFSLVLWRIFFTYGSPPHRPGSLILLARKWNKFQNI